MPDETDAKKILNSFPLENWDAGMKTVQQDLKSNSFCVNEATDVAQNRPLWMSTFATTHSKWCMPEISE